jgi:glycosyltransferase involved in cell wall biosynthesis
MTKKRVLIIYRSLSHLGPATAIRNLIDNMSGEYDFHVLTLNHEFSTGRRLFAEAHHTEIAGSAVFEYGPRGLRGLAVLFRRLRGNFDIVDVHCAFDPLLSIPALVLCWLGVASGSRVFHTPHGIFMDVIMSANPLKKRLFCGLADVIGLYRGVVHLAGSPGEENDIKRNHRRAQNVRTVSQFVESATSHRVVRRKPTGTLNIAFVGRVTIQKNLAFAIEALRQLSVPSTFDIFGEVGEDAYARRCVEMIDAGVGRCRVTFKGNVAKQDLFEQLSRYDILLHPTRGENFGHAIVEALTAGLPVLISDKSPWTDVSELNAGWSLPLSQPSAFSEKLEVIYQMGDGWSAMSDGAIRYSHATFDGERTAERYREAYG